MSLKQLRDVGVSTIGPRAAQLDKDWRLAAVEGLEQQIIKSDKHLRAVVYKKCADYNEIRLRIDASDLEEMRDEDGSGLNQSAARWRFGSGVL